MIVVVLTDIGEWYLKGCVVNVLYLHYMVGVS